MGWKGIAGKQQFLCCPFFSFCCIYIADSELGIIIWILIVILSGASFALVKRISIVYFKKCRITSLTRSRRVVTSLLRMIQEFCRQRILTGIIFWWWILPLNKAAWTVQWRATCISSHKLPYDCRPHGSLGLSIRDVTHNTRYSWECLMDPWCYKWTGL